jgi:hypothetical protein
MKLIVGLHVEKHLVIGAGTRASYYPNNDFFFPDDEEKIRTTAVGLVTGAGLCNLLDPVKQRFADEVAPDTFAMQRSSKRRRRAEVVRFADYPDKRVQAWRFRRGGASARAPHRTDRSAATFGSSTQCVTQGPPDGAGRTGTQAVG